MDQQLNALEERLRKIEVHINRVIGGAVVLSVCCLAFLGIQYWRLPGEVDTAIRARIDDATINRINEAKSLADSLLASRLGVEIGSSTSTWNVAPVPNQFIEVCDVSITTSGGSVWVGLIGGAGYSFLTQSGDHNVYTYFRLVRDEDHEVAKYRSQPPAENSKLELPPSCIHAIDFDPPHGRHRYSLEIRNANPGTGNALSIFRARLAAFEIPTSVRDTPDKAVNPSGGSGGN